MAFNLKDLIVEALTALGGAGTVEEVRQYIKSRHGKDWKNMKKIMDDLRSDTESAFFPEEDKVLGWMGQGKYFLKEVAASDFSEAAVLAEEPKPSLADEVNVKLEHVVALFFDKLKLVLNQPTYRFATVYSTRIPAESGVFVIHDESSKKLIYAGRSKNLRVRLLQQHKQGNIRGSQFRKALGQKYNLGSAAEISAYIKEQL
jgi:hypothetical protein